MDDATRQFVERRAANRCEYCHLPQGGHEERFSVDHITARKHGGDDSTDNLAFCCLRCNLYKGTDLTGIDTESSAIVSLFHPRRDQWPDHIRWSGPMLVGISSVGRATVSLLRMNTTERLQLRQALLSEGMLLT